MSRDDEGLCYKVKVWLLSLPHIPVPVNLTTMRGYLFDPHHTQKQLSWNATDTVGE